MHPDAPYFSMLLCLMPDDFTHQVESAAPSLNLYLCTDQCNSQGAGAS